MTKTAKDRILDGVNILADTVKLTLGTKGQTVLYNKKRDFEDPKGYAVLTKDGVTVAKQISSYNPVEDMAIQIVREAAQKTVLSSGDGTTTTTILAQSIIQNGLKLISEGHMSSWEFNKEADKTVALIVDEIIKMSQPIDGDFDKVKKVATISSNDAVIGELIHEIIEEVGIYADVEPKRSNNYATEVELVKGMKLHKGYMAPFFCTDKEKMEFLASDGCYILIFDDVIRDYNDIASYVRAAVDSDGMPVPLLIFAEDVAATVLNRLDGMLQFNNRPLMIVEHDGFGDRRIELMNDVALITGGYIVDNQTRVQTPLKYMGWCDEVHVTQRQTCLYGGRADEKALKEEIELIERKLSAVDLDRGDKKYYNKRLANMAGGLAVINVGGKTKVEMEEAYARIEDAVLAVKSALRDGVVPGGGYTWIKVYHELEQRLSHNKASSMVLQSLLEIPKQLLHNAGTIDKLDELVTMCVDKNQAYDLIDGKFHDVKNYEVYDATSVLIDSITNAVAVAKSILSIGAAVYDGEVR